VPVATGVGLSCRGVEGAQDELYKVEGRFVVMLPPTRLPVPICAGDKVALGGYHSAISLVVCAR
jgi:hypothetical protein